MDRDDLAQVPHEDLGHTIPQSGQSISLAPLEPYVADARTPQALLSYSQLGGPLADLCDLADLLQRRRQPEQGDDEPDRSCRYRNGRPPVDDPARPGKRPLDDLFGVPIVLGTQPEPRTETGQQVRRGL